jgi:hypothetical protein
MPVIPSSSNYSVQLSGTRIIRRALRILGSTQSGEDPSADETQDALEALNDLLDTWNSESFTVPAMAAHTFALVSGTQSYTIGPAATFDMFRPRQIKQGEAKVKQGTIEYPLKVYTRNEWASLAMRDAVTSIPYGVFYDNESPTATVSFYPIPGADYFVLYCPTMLAKITVPSEIFYLPPAYSEALKYGLAVRLWPEYPNPQILPVITEMAAATKAAAKRPNTVPDVMTSELQKVSGGTGWIDAAAFQRGGY